MNLKRLFIFLLLSWSSVACNQPELPQGFVYLHDYSTTIQQDVRYFGSDNFVGGPVKGYEKPVVICTKEAAMALVQVESELEKRGFGLLVYDGYRPQRAVNHFINWAKDLADTTTKSKYYPEVNKNQLFELNYIASKSSHSRGSTFDLTLVDNAGEILDMGSFWDYFGRKSWPSDTTISEEGQQNRKILREAMIQNGFTPYREEWWHFTLAKEPFPETYFDFVVK